LCYNPARSRNPKNRKESNMFGFGDLGVTLAYLLTLFSVVLSIVYAIRKWNAEEEMPAAHHPPEENLEFEDEV